jgi:hypothetical protein
LKGERINIERSSKHFEKSQSSLLKYHKNFHGSSYEVGKKLKNRFKRSLTEVCKMF